MNADIVALCAAVLQGLSKTTNEPIESAEAVVRARRLYLETVRQLHEQTVAPLRPEIGHD